MKECPKCHTQYDDSMNFCTKDGCQLIDVNTDKSNNTPKPQIKKSSSWLKKTVVTIVIIAVVMAVFYNYIMNAATYLRVEPNQIGSVKAGGECRVEIDYDGYVWTINHKPNWVSVHEHDEDFSLRIEPNKSGETREGSITIQSGRQVAQVFIKQLGHATRLRALQSELKFSSAGGTRYVDMETDGCGWTSQALDWVYEKRDWTVRPKDKKAVIECWKNTGEYRTGSITFKEDNVSTTVYVTQGGICNNCHGKGEIICSNCGGLGSSNWGFYSSQCVWCCGAGKFKCTVCNGTGERE